jgi:hypothetical protein
MVPPCPVTTLLGLMAAGLATPLGLGPAGLIIRLPWLPGRLTNPLGAAGIAGLAILKPRLGLGATNTPDPGAALEGDATATPNAAIAIASTEVRFKMGRSCRFAVCPLVKGHDRPSTRGRTW